MALEGLHFEHKYVTQTWINIFKTFLPDKKVKIEYPKKSWKGVGLVTHIPFHMNALHSTHKYFEKSVVYQINPCNMYKYIQ